MPHPDDAANLKKFIPPECPRAKECSLISESSTETAECKNCYQIFTQLQLARVIAGKA